MASIFPVDGKTFNGKLFSRIRVAIESDVPHIYKLMQQLFIYHNITHLLKSTESSIASGLFNPKFPHLSPVTTLLVEVSASPFPACPNGKTSSKEVELNLPLIDEEAEQFRAVVKHDHDVFTLIDEEAEQFRAIVKHDHDVFIAGYVMFYPCFSSFFEKPVFHMENFFIRESYRRKGLGKWLFSTMASEAAKMGFSSIDWYASDWNVSALDFYTKNGATISDDFRVLSLCGTALEAFEDDNN